MSIAFHISLNTGIEKRFYIFGFTHLKLSTSSTDISCKLVYAIINSAWMAFNVNLGVSFYEDNDSTYVKENLIMVYVLKMKSLPAKDEEEIFLMMSYLASLMIHLV